MSMHLSLKAHHDSRVDVFNCISNKGVQFNKNVHTRVLLSGAGCLYTVKMMSCYVMLCTGRTTFPSGFWSILNGTAQKSRADRRVFPNNVCFAPLRNLVLTDWLSTCPLIGALLCTAKKKKNLFFRITIAQQAWRLSGFSGGSLYRQHQVSSAAGATVKRSRFCALFLLTHFRPCFDLL